MTAEGPLASVVVLGYNGREYLEDCLGSVTDQDLPQDQYEVVYADNGSRDGSAAFVRERYPSVRVVEFERNYGYAEGNNRAVEQTTGRYVVFLNQDVVVHRSWLRESVAALESAPDVGAAHANTVQPWYPEYAGMAGRAMPDVTYTAELTRLGYAHYRKLGRVEGAVDVLFLHGVSIIIRRNVLERLGYAFDPDFFAYAEDMDLGLRVRNLGYRCVVAPQAVVYHKHTLKTQLSPRVALHTARIIRNRYLAFYKVMSGWEFAAMAPLLTFGAPLNALEFGLPPARRVLYGLALVPATALALVTALLSLPRYASKRRAVLAQRAGRSPWCLRAVWRAGAGRAPGLPSERQPA
jgi:GT2 family glycosyltransferase